MTLYVKNANTYKITSEKKMDLHHTLPAGNYVVKQDPFGAFYIEEIEPFELPPKLYGDVTQMTDRILNTYNSREGSTGILLNGEKGSGKTLLAKNLSIVGAQRGIPTLIINNAFVGDAFNLLIQSIEQPCIILFDEFEKVYPQDHQEAVLTLLDGVFPTKKMFVFTCNQKHRVSEYMRNRPGRIFYLIDYTGLTSEFIIEYCNDNLNDKTHIDYMSKLPLLFFNFNFDMLKAIVEEMNRYDEDPRETLKLINARPEFSNKDSFEVELYIDGVHEKEASKNWYGNPLNQLVELYTPRRNSEGQIVKDEDGDVEEDYVIFTSNHLQKVSSSGTFSFTMDNKRLLLKKKPSANIDYYSMF